MEITLAVLFVIAVVGTALYMFAQKPAGTAVTLIQSERYEEAVAESDRLLERGKRDAATWIHRGEAQKLLGAFEQSLHSFEQAMSSAPDDAAAREGVALSLAHLRRDLDRAYSLMNETLTAYPQIQEFQALALAFIALQAGRRDEATRLYEDNAVLLQTRFTDDYTDPDPLLADTLYQYAVVAEAAGDRETAQRRFSQIRQWAPRSVFARSSERS